MKVKSISDLRRIFVQKDFFISAPLRCKVVEVCEKCLLRRKRERERQRRYRARLKDRRGVK